MEKYGFVYIWFDSKHKRYYIGCRWGNVNDGYICSSSWMKRAYKIRPEDFKRRILKSNILDRKELLNEEYKWLELIKTDELGVRYYNLHNHHFGHWSAEDNNLTVREKISKTKTGAKIGPMSKETKQKIRDANSGKKLTEEHKQKIRDANIGKVQSEETILKRVNKVIGIKRGPMSEENKEKLRKPKSNTDKMKKPKSKEHKLKLSEAAKRRGIKYE